MDEQTRMAVAEAILDRGSPGYTMADGPMLDRLSKIAERGDLSAFSGACNAYVSAVPKSRRVLEDYAPAKIMSAYICRQPGVDQSKASELQAEDPQWAERIQAALWTPASLTGVVEPMVARLKDLSTGAPRATSRC